MKIKDKQHSLLNHKVSPSESAWFRLETKLERKRSAQKFNKYKYMSIAACMIVLLGVVSAMISKLDTFHQSKEANLPYTVDRLVLSSDLDYNIYEPSKLKNLKLAYSKHAGKPSN